MKAGVIRTLVIIIAACIVGNVLYQIFQKATTQYETQTALSETVDKRIAVEGMFFKDELVISSDTIGVVEYLYSDGDKVAKQSNVAMAYQSTEDVLATEQMKNLDLEIKQLNVAQTVDPMVDDLSLINKQLANDCYELSGNLARGQLSDLSSQKIDMTMLLNKRQILIGEVNDFQSSIQQMNQKKQELSRQIAATPQAIVTPTSGYFVGRMDGHESNLSLSYAKSITVEELQNLIEQQKELEAQEKGKTTAENVIGKVISQPVLEYVALLPSQSVRSVKAGQSCTIEFSKLSGSVDATIDMVKPYEETDKSLVTVSIKNITAELAAMRYDSADIVLGSYTGIRVPKTAVRTNDAGELGVFVVNGANMAFKKVDSIYEDEGCIVSREHPDDSSYLGLHDSIITEGKDLYENKSIR